jgi:hypothetical protein
MSSRTKVMNGSANKTSGGLTANDLVKNNKNRIVSAARSENARSSEPLALWRQVCAEYLQGGGFTKIPKKGTAAYNKLMLEYHTRLGR